MRSTGRHVHALAEPDVLRLDATILNDQRRAGPSSSRVATVYGTSSRQGVRLYA